MLLKVKKHILKTAFLVISVNKNISSKNEIFYLYYPPKEK